MILPPTSEISHHHKVINITMSPLSLSPLGNYEDIWENGQDFISINDASSIPRIWIFCPEFTDRG